MFGFFERRKEIRVKVNIPVDVLLPDDVMPTTTTIVEVSAEGFLIKIERPWSEGQKLSLHFTLPPTNVRPKGTPVVVDGLVIHVKRRDERFFDIGVKIESFEGMGAEEYAKYLANLK